MFWPVFKKAESFMAGNSFQIEGEAKNDFCTLRRIALAREVYRLDQADIEKAEAMPFVEKKVDKALEEWSEDDVENDQSDSGFVAKLFKSTHDIGDHKCAPTLVFRGSDFHRWSGLGVYIRIKMGPVVFGFVLKTDDATISEPIPGLEFYYGRLDGLGIPGSVGSTASNTARWQEEAAADLYFASKGFEITLRRSLDLRVYIEGVQRWMPALPVGANLTFKVYTHRTKGDWATNLRQALGQKAKQYDLAEILFEELIDGQMHAPSKDLFVIGHSLGGGLASYVSVLAAPYIRSNQIDDFKCVTLNTAGLHAKTVEPASLSSGSASNFSVRDEILSLLQSFATRLPLVGKLLEHLNIDVPTALDTPSDFGAFVYENGAYVAKSNLLPQPTRLAPKLSGLNRAFNGGGSLQDSIDNALGGVCI